MIAEIQLVYVNTHSQHSINYNYGILTYDIAGIGTSDLLPGIRP